MSLNETNIRTQLALTSGVFLDLFEDVLDLLVRGGLRDGVLGADDVVVRVHRHVDGVLDRLVRDRLVVHHGEDLPAEHARHVPHRGRCRREHGSHFMC